MSARVFTSFALLGAVFAATPAFARAPERLVVTASSSCPSAHAIVHELGPLLRHTELSPDTKISALDSEHSEVIDQGDGILVRARGQERALSDPTRDCRERARSVAVIIALIVDPPLLGEELQTKETKRSPRDHAQTSVLPAKPASTRLMRLQLGPVIQVAPASDALKLPMIAGLSARAAFGRTLGISVGSAAQLPMTIRLEPADARLFWLPVDVSLRAAREFSALEFGAELGPQLTLLFARGARVPNPRTGTRVEASLRAALSATWQFRRQLGGFLSLHGLFVPKPSEFELNPGLRAGSTPSWWIGASIGVVFTD